MGIIWKKENTGVKSLLMIWQCLHSYILSNKWPLLESIKKEIQPSANGKKSFAIKLTAAVISEETSLNFSEDSNGAYDS